MRVGCSGHTHEINLLVQGSCCCGTLRGKPPICGKMDTPILLNVPLDTGRVRAMRDAHVRGQRRGHVLQSQLFLGRGDRVHLRRESGSRLVWNIEWSECSIFAGGQREILTWRSRKPKVLEKSCASASSPRWPFLGCSLTGQNVVSPIGGIFFIPENVHFPSRNP